MTRSFNPLFAHEVIECVSEGREPTMHELFRLAERIWQESAVERPAFAWGALPPADPERQCSLRAAMAAAMGTEASPTDIGACGAAVDKANDVHMLCIYQAEKNDGDRLPCR